MFWWVAISPLSLAYNVVLNVLADKHQQDYSKMISWLRYSTRLSLMTSALSDGGMLIIPCTNRPDQCMECKVPLDVAICEGHIASHSTLNYSFTNFCPSTLLYIWLISNPGCTPGFGWPECTCDLGCMFGQVYVVLTTTVSYSVAGCTKERWVRYTENISSQHCDGNLQSNSKQLQVE